MEQKKEKVKHGLNDYKKTFFNIKGANVEESTKNQGVGDVIGRIIFIENMSLLSKEQNLVIWHSLLPEVSVSGGIHYVEGHNMQYLPLLMAWVS